MPLIYAEDNCDEELKQSKILLYLIDKINTLNDALEDCDERSYKFEKLMEQLETLEELKDIEVDEIYRRSHPEFNKDVFGLEN